MDFAGLNATVSVSTTPDASGPSEPSRRTQSSEPARFIRVTELNLRSLHLLRPVTARREGPSMLEELVNLIGHDAAARLIEIFGGTRLYVPHSPHEDDLLSGSLGPEAALKLASIYGGDRIEVPNPTPRRARILELRETGCSVDAIARKLGCTRRRVFQVLAEARATKRSA
jgi:hypothetical protein